MCVVWGAGYTATTAVAGFASCGVGNEWLFCKQIMLPIREAAKLGCTCAHAEANFLCPTFSVMMILASWNDHLGH